MKKEFTKEQRYFVTNLRLILDKKGWTNKKLADQVIGLQESNLSTAFNMRSPLGADVSQRIAETLGEKIEDMNREGYAKKKYYAIDDIDVMEMLVKTPYNDAVMKLFIYYAVTFSISAGIASLFNYSAIAVFTCVSINFFIVLMSPVMSKYVKVEKSKIRSVVDRFIQSHKLMMMIAISIIEILLCSQQYYENNMMLLLIFVLFDSSGIYSLNFMKKKENKTGKLYYISLVIFKTVFVCFVYLFFADVYHKAVSFFG